MLCGARPAMGLRGVTPGAMAFRGTTNNMTAGNVNQNFKGNTPSFAGMMHTDSQLLQAENAKFMIKA